MTFFVVEFGPVTDKSGQHSNIIINMYMCRHGQIHSHPITRRKMSLLDIFTLEKLKVQ